MLFRCSVQTVRQTAKETQPRGSLLKGCRIVWNASGPESENQTRDHERHTTTMGATSMEGRVEVGGGGGGGDNKAL